MITDICAHGIPELPERVCVESRFISRDEAERRNLPYLDLGSKENSQQIISNNLPTHILPLPALKVMINTEVMTDSPNPMRDRCFQTEIQTNTIAIQCDLTRDEADSEFSKHFEAPSNGSQPDENNIKSEKEGFSNFIKEKTQSYSNGKLECLLCGEIKATAKSMESHMALHWGPEVLCFRCGLSFEHKTFWKQHNCALKRTNQLRYIKCPHYLCGASLISPLELYDHLNEHCDISLHKCTFCSKSFPTTGELRAHFKIHKKCRKNAQKIPPHDVYKIPVENTKYRKRVYISKTPSGKKVLVKSFLSQIALQRNNRSHYCNTCLLRCRSFAHYQFHVKRCLAIHRRRLKRKRMYQAVDAMLANDANNVKQ